MRFLAGVVLGLIVAPTVSATYRKNQTTIEDKAVDVLQGLARRFGMELYVSREGNR